MCISQTESCERVQRTGFFFTRESAIAFRSTAISSHSITISMVRSGNDPVPSPGEYRSFQSANAKALSKFWFSCGRAARSQLP